jgi:hypothetical protein
VQATGDAGDKTSRVFDLAYEQLSGEVLLVYRESGTELVRYRTFNGAAWSTEGSFDSKNKDNLYWLKLIPKPGTNEIMLIGLSSHSAHHTKAALWDGAGFTADVSLWQGFGGIGANREYADGAFGSLSGQGLALHSDNDATPNYRSLIGTTWLTGQDVPSVGAVPHWARLASDPASDEIIMATLDINQDVNVNVWNGLVWGMNLEAQTSSASMSRRGFDVAYEKDGNEALLAYDDNSNTLKYRTWNGFGWTGEFPGPTGGASPLWTVQTVTGLVNGEVFVNYVTDSAEIRSVHWDGSTFGTAAIIATSSAPKEYENFMAATCAGLGSSTQVINWQEVQP